MNIPFDELVDTFEATRGLPLLAQEGLIKLVDDLAEGSRLRILDVGAGVGRLSLPMLMRGHDVVAIDISPAMLAQMALKLAAASPLIGSCRLVRANVVALPFAEDTFEAALIANVLYLVTDWRAALTEVSRVLQPDGALLFVIERSTSSPELERFDTRWREIIEATGYRHPPSSAADDEVVAELANRATTCDVRELATWTIEQTVDEALDRYGERLRALYAAVPDATWRHAVDTFTAWAHTDFTERTTHLDCTVALQVAVARGLR